jgi:DNA-binding MarR family transcriptional regulator
MADQALLQRLDRLATIMPQIIRYFQRVPVRPTETPPVSLPQLRMLVILEMEGDSTMGDLARRAGVTMPTATASVNALVDGGYATRRRAQYDRRVVLVRITAKGREAMEELNQERRERLRTLLAHLGPDEQVQLVDAFEAILRLFREIDAALEADEGSEGSEEET